MQTGSFMKVWMPARPRSAHGRLTCTGPGGRAGTAKCGCSWAGAAPGPSAAWSWLCDTEGSCLDSWVGGGLEQVHHGVDEDVGHAEQQHHAGDGREVVDGDALRGVLAQAR